MDLLSIGSLKTRREELQYGKFSPGDGSLDTEENRYPLTKDDHELFVEIKKLVRNNLDYFRDAGAALESKFGSQAMRDQLARDIKGFRREYPRAVLSRASQWKHAPAIVFYPPIDLNTIPREQIVYQPPMRKRGPDGKLLRPEWSLVHRFGEAWRDEFVEGTALRLLRKDQRIEAAERRLLLAWLYIDPDRQDVPWITAFQRLETVPTQDGLPNLVIDQDAEAIDLQVAVHVRADGSLSRFNYSWIEMAREALEELQSQCHAPPNSAGTHRKEKQREKWQVIQDRLIEMFNRGEVYTSTEKLGKLLGCGKHTVAKAIKKSQDLQNWSRRSPNPRATPLSDLVVDGLADGREVDPADHLSDEDFNEGKASFLSQYPGRQAELESMDQEAQRRFISLYLDHVADDQCDKLSFRRA